jgi:hypothetical protein
MDTRDRDRGSIVVGWLGKIAITLAIVGVALFDGVSVGVAHMNAQDDANAAASAANAEWSQTHDIQGAYNAAVDSISNSDETVLTKGFTIDQDGTVHLVLRRTATTLVMAKIGPLKKYTVFTVQGEATTPAS